MKAKGLIQTANHRLSCFLIVHYTSTVKGFPRNASRSLQIIELIRCDVWRRNFLLQYYWVRVLLQLSNYVSYVIACAAAAAVMDVQWSVTCLTGVSLN